MPRTDWVILAGILVALGAILVSEFLPEDADAVNGTNPTLHQECLNTALWAYEVKYRMYSATHVKAHAAIYGLEDAGNRLAWQIATCDAKHN